MLTSTTTTDEDTVMTESTERAAGGIPEYTAGTSTFSCAEAVPIRL